jgi:hypothetical protein
VGHERIGFLPKTRQWRAIVAAVAGTAVGDSDVAAVANETLQAVRIRYAHMHQDAGVRAAFEFLVGLGNASGLRGEHDPWIDFSVDLSTNPSTLQLAKALRAWVGEHAESREFADIATRAATDAIVSWQTDYMRQEPLFVGAGVATAWSKAATGAGFCELSRLFFSSFTERYLKYFLEREASIALPSIDARDQFARDLSSHVDAVSRHAFETAKITQSFAAGWYSKHAQGARPSRRALEGFLRTAFSKLREELARQVRSA